MDSKGFKEIILALDRSQRFLEFQDRRDLLLTIWQCVVDEMEVCLESDTLCIGILAFSKYQKSKYQQMARHLVSRRLMGDGDAILELKQIECHYILRALGNCNDLNGMWTFYEVLSTRNGARSHVLTL